MLQNKTFKNLISHRAMMEQNRLAHLLVQVHGSSRRLPQLVGDLLTLQQTDRL